MLFLIRGGQNSITDIKFSKIINQNRHKSTYIYVDIDIFWNINHQIN